MPLICILKSNQSSLDKKQKTVPFNEQKSHGFSLLLRIEIEEVNNVAPLIGEIKKRGKLFFFPRNLFKSTLSLFLPGSAVPELNLFLGGFEAFCGESMYVHKSLVLDFVIFLKEEEQCMYAYMHALFLRIMHKKTTLSYRH